MLENTLVNFRNDTLLYDRKTIMDCEPKKVHEFTWPATRKQYQDRIKDESKDQLDGQTNVYILDLMVAFFPRF